MDYPSREELLVLKMKIGSDPEPLWKNIQLWMMDLPSKSYVYRHLYGSQSIDESRFTPILEVYAEWVGECLSITPYRYHDHPQMDLIDPSNPIGRLIRIAMEDIWE